MPVRVKSCASTGMTKHTLRSNSCRGGQSKQLLFQISSRAFASTSDGKEGEKEEPKDGKGGSDDGENNDKDSGGFFRRCFQKLSRS